MRLAVLRSSRRMIDEKRYAQLLDDKLTPHARRQKARALRQPDPPGIHCGFCGAVKKSFDLPCPNDGQDYPHPRSQP